MDLANGASPAASAAKTARTDREPSDRPRTGPRGWVGRITRWAPVLVVLAAIAGLALRLGVGAVVRKTTWMTPDLYQTLLATRAAGMAQQFVGPWSRIGVFHPGPLWFYWAAPFLWLADGHASGLLLAAGVLVACCAVGMVIAVGWIEGRAAALGAGAATALGLLRLDVLGLSAPWNPTVLILPTAAGIVLAAATIARGSWRAFIVAVVCGTFVAQAHLAALPIGGVIVVAAVVGFVVPRFRTRRAAGLRALALALLLVVLPWAPVFYDQVAGQHNASAIVEYSLAGTVDGADPPPQRGVSLNLRAVDAVRQVASVAFLAEPGAALWAGVQVKNGIAHVPATRSLVAGAVVVAGAIVVGWPRRRRLAGDRRPTTTLPWAARLGLVLLAIEVITAVRLRHEFRPYLVASAAGVGLALWVTVAAEAARSLARWLDGRSVATVVRPLGAAAVAVLCLATIPAARSSAPDGPGLQVDPAAVDRILETADGRPIRLSLDPPWQKTQATLLMLIELAGRGQHVAVRGEFDAQVSDAERHAPWQGMLLEIRRSGAPSIPGCHDITHYLTVILCTRDA